MPRSPWRLAGFIVVVLGLQVSLVGVVAALSPFSPVVGARPIRGARASTATRSPWPTLSL